MAKLNLFTRLSDGKWRIKFFTSKPNVHTLREFTPLEKEDSRNYGLKGVRTFWFGAHHWRGLPSFVFEDKKDDTTEFMNYAWVPKRQLNEYFTKD